MVHNWIQLRLRLSCLPTACIDTTQVKSRANSMWRCTHVPLGIPITHTLTFFMLGEANICSGRWKILMTSSTPPRQFATSSLATDDCDVMKFLFGVVKGCTKQKVYHMYSMVHLHNKALRSLSPLVAVDDNNTYIVTVDTLSVLCFCLSFRIVVCGKGQLSPSCQRADWWPSVCRKRTRTRQPFSQ